MFKRIVALVLVFGLAASAAIAAPVVAKKLKKRAVIKKAVQKKSVKQIKNVSDQEQAEAPDQIADLKESMNKAISELRGQVDTVKSDNNDAKVSGEFRFAWSKVNGASATPNQFDVTRAYLTVKKKLAYDAAFRMTLDVGRLAATSTFKGSGATSSTTGTVSTTMSTSVLSDYLKYCYIDLPINIPAAVQLVPFTLTAKIGLQHNMWIDWADKIWENAFIMKQYDDNEGLMSSADFGLGATGKVSVPSLPDIEYHAVLFNGTGYKSAETENSKDIGIRLNSDVYKDDNIGTVTVGGYVYSKNSILAANGAGALNQKNAALLVALKNEDWGTAYAEYMKGTNITGTSIGGYLSLNSYVPNVGLLARVDSYDPSTLVSNNEISRSVVGAYYNWGKDMKIALDMQKSKTGTGAETQTYYMHTVVNF